jgi:predicted transcriptional regulator
MSEVSEFIEKTFSLPESLSRDKEYLFIPKEQLEVVLTPLRRQIIDLLFRQNPITEEKLDNLFRRNTHKDLQILKHLELIERESIDEDSKHDIITLNREIKVI